MNSVSMNYRHLNVINFDICSVILNKYWGDKKQGWKLEAGRAQLDI